MKSLIFYWKLRRSRNLKDLIAIADEYVFHGELEKIIEVTYTYREIWEEQYILNETLFENYTGKKYPEYDISSLWRECKYKLGVQIAMIDEIIAKVSKIEIDSRSASLRRGMFSDALIYVKNTLELALLWADFELEKAGENLHIHTQQIDERLQDIESLERKIFWRKVCEDTYEFSFCYNFVLQNHESKRKSIGLKDAQAMDYYLKEIRHNAEAELVPTSQIQRKILKGNFLKIEIPRKDYRKIFDSVCELYNLPQRTRLSNAGSIYDWDHYLEIPRNDGHAFFSIERILKLLSHEIESHYINSYNGRILLGNFRGSKNLPKEEGLAMFMEKIFHGYNYDTIDNIVEYFFTIMAWETLKWEDFTNFMRILWKEYNTKRNYEVAVIRAKRNYSFSSLWVQHKDVVYFRGLTQTLEYLKSGWEFRKLFLWKVGFDDLDNIFDIYQMSERKADIVFPLFISDIIWYYFTELQKNPDFVFEAPEYYLHVKKKYWFLWIESFKIIPRIQKDWKKIEKIIKMFEKYIDS